MGGRDWPILAQTALLWTAICAFCPSPAHAAEDATGEPDLIVVDRRELLGELATLEAQLRLLESQLPRTPTGARGTVPVRLEEARATLSRLRAALEVPPLLPPAPAPGPPVSPGGVSLGAASPPAGSIRPPIPPATPVSPPQVVPQERPLVVIAPPTPTGPTVVVQTSLPTASTSPPAPQPLPAPIDAATLARVREAIGAEPFGQGKLRVIETAASHHWFQVEQCLELLGDLSFEQDKLKALRLLSPRIVDRQNAFALYEVFDFESSRDEAERILR